MTSDEESSSPSSASNSLSEGSRVKEDQQSFFFINSTGSAVSRTNFAQKTVRAQAARASAGSRIETTAARRKAKRHLASAPRSPPRIPPKTATRSPSASPDLASDWTCNLVSIVRQTFEVAVAEMVKLQINCDIALLVSLLEDSTLRNQSLMWDCIALAVNYSAVFAGRRKLSRSSIVWQRHSLVIAIQDAVQPNKRPEPSIVPVVLLLAGWELIHGENQAATVHLRALPELLQQPIIRHNSGEPSLVLNPFEAPQAFGSIPDGFEFYKQNSLLPACLMDMVGSIASVNLTTPDGSILMKQFGAAVAACRPSNEQSDGKETGSVAVRHVMAATGILIALLLPPIRESFIEEDMMQCLEMWHAESLALNSVTLVGTVYDEILLWAVTVFLCIPQEVSAKQAEISKALLETLHIRQSDELVKVMQRYLCPPVLMQRIIHKSPSFFGS